jgi:Protein of unknown function (DUF2961)
MLLRDERMQLMSSFNSVEHGLGALSQLSTARSRSISAENRTGEKGGGARAVQGTGAEAARDLGLGWKISPSIKIAPHALEVLADITDAGAIQHIWMTTHQSHWRSLILRIYWDGDQQPAVETPLGDFFCNGWNEFSQVSSLPIAVNPRGGFNSYWEMPFRKAARITLENLSNEEVVLYFQIDYALAEVSASAAYFHARWNRSNPLPYKTEHTLLEGVNGSGHYVGTYIAWGVNNTGWWGEGEIKFYLDGDQAYPTICGTGTEDYFGGAWNFDVPDQGYTLFTTPFLGLHQILKPDGLYRSQQRFGMYRWHIPDPIHFSQDIRVTIQALGWRSGGRYLPLQDDISSTAFWYQKETSSRPATVFDADFLEVV